MNTLNLIGRSKELFLQDIEDHNHKMADIIGQSSFLILGAAGSIGQAVTKEIFKRNPKQLVAIDLSENNLAELVRDLRSSIGYGTGEFSTLAIDIGSKEFDAFIDGKQFDYVLNLSALKHVRSERDPFTLMRMVDVNIFNTHKTALQAAKMGAKKYFCVSTDKATNPVNMMGASKKIMELFLMDVSQEIPISTARFANVAFSDGSLLQSFNHRISKQQPIAAPNDVKRYFVTSKEAGELCLLSCLFGENRDIFFPKLSEELHLISFDAIAKKYLNHLGYEAVNCNSEEEARTLIKSLPEQNQWPCYFSESDTTGEKDFEEFYTENETVDFDRFINIGVIKNSELTNAKLDWFTSEINQLKESGSWTKQDIVSLFETILPDFKHEEKGKNLDAKM